jgi:hypothetical protein
MQGLFRMLLALSLVPPGIPGRYETCYLNDLLCTAVVDLRLDGSFLITFDDQPPMQGTWLALESGLLLANTLDQPSPATVKLESHGTSEYVTICVTDDATGRPVSHVEVFLDAGYFSYADLTNSRGCVRALRGFIQGFYTNHHLFEPFHQDLPGKTATRVRVRLLRKRPHITNEQWLLLGDKLYRLSAEPLTRRHTTLRDQTPNPSLQRTTTGRSPGCRR